MCGIAGFIGTSFDMEVSYDLASNLFDFLELRGTDAAGIWASERNTERVAYQKEPIKSSRFIMGDFWKNLDKINFDIMLLHARATSSGNGHARFNQNNHPFVSDDHRIGMVHNGTINEANYLTEKYTTRSCTDSEVLLRMYEHGLGQELECEEISKKKGFYFRLPGIKNIWSTITYGAMAVAIGERVSATEKYMFLFRNDHRPLWLADLRETLGQVFFFSTPEIWFRAVASSDRLVKFCNDTSPKLIEIPTNEIWCFKITEDDPHVLNKDNTCRITVNVSNQSKSWDSGSPLEIPQPACKLEVLTELDQHENVVFKPKPAIITTYNYKSPYASSPTDIDDNNCDQFTTKYPDVDGPVEDFIVDNELSEEDNEEDIIEEYYGGLLHEDILEELSALVQNIDVEMTNSVSEMNIDRNSYQETVRSLESIREDLSNILAGLELN